MAWNIQAAVDAAISAAVQDANVQINTLQSANAGLQTQLTALNQALQAEKQKVLNLEAALAACEADQPAPDPDPVPVPPPSTGFPDSSNTGPTGTLTSMSGTQTLSTAGAVFENKNLSGNIVVRADNVTIRNCKITSSTYHAIQNANNKGLKVLNCEINGQGATNNGIYGPGTFQGNDIYGVENGFNTWGSSTNKTDISGNYVHALKNAGSPHYDGIEINGGTDITINNNTVIVDYGQTAALMLNNYFGGLARITANNNKFVGGGYTVYCDDSFSGGSVDGSTISITNNKLGKGYWGYWALYSSGVQLSGNTDLTTGAAV